MKLVASDGVLLPVGKAAEGRGGTDAHGLTRPIRERVFLSEAGSYVRRTANHRDDPVLCELCGSVTEAFQAQQLRVNLLGHLAEVMKWKNDKAGHHLRAGPGSARFCVAHNQRNVGSQYRSAFRTSAQADKWREALGLASLHPDSIVQNMTGRDIALALSSPRVGERLIGKRLTQLAEAEQRRPEFIAQAWRTFYGRDQSPPTELATASSIEFTQMYPFDQSAYGNISDGCYRFDAAPGLYERCVEAFPSRSPVSSFLSLKNFSEISARSGMEEGAFFLPDWVRDTFDQNPSMGPYEAFVEEVSVEVAQCRELALWVPDVRGWVVIDSTRNGGHCVVSDTRVRSQSVTLTFEPAKSWQWALRTLWSKREPVFAPEIGSFLLPENAYEDVS